VDSDPADPPVERPATAGRAGAVEPDGLGPFYRRNTPSVAGYVAAAFIALVIGSVLVPLAFGGAGTFSDFLIGVWLILVVGSFVVLILGLPLTVAAHFALRNVPSQGVHIATFAGVGLLTGALVSLTFDQANFTPTVVLAVGVSAAAGRAVVNRRPR
jgi:hypothetical protein